MNRKSNIRHSRFLSMVASALAAVVLGNVNLSKAQDKSTGKEQRSAYHVLPSLDNIKHIKAGVLSIGYAEQGPSNGEPVILLHGWPYDINSYAEVSALLVAKGYRVIVPYLRGHGTTHFLSAETPRNGQQSA